MRLFRWSRTRLVLSLLWLPASLVAVVPRLQAEPPTPPPYYAIQIWPMLVNTQGGPRRDQHARVIDLEGRPIPGLFAAGEFGSIWGFLYPGGGNFAEAIIYGRIAGKSVAAGSPVGL